MKYDKHNSNHVFLVTKFKNIVKTEHGYKLQPVYEVKNGEIVETEESKNNPQNNQFDKRCHQCIYLYAKCNL